MDQPGSHIEPTLDHGLKLVIRTFGTAPSPINGLYVEANEPQHCIR